MVSCNLSVSISGCSGTYDLRGRGRESLAARAVYHRCPDAIPPAQCPHRADCGIGTHPTEHSERRGDGLDLSLRFLEELALLLVLAAGTAYLLARVHVPPLLGYLVAGLLLGQGGIGIITQVDFVRALGDLGVILIMFGLGLDFEMDRLRHAATLSILAGVASVVLTFVAVNGACLLLGLSPLAALFLASAHSICGTAVNLKILSDLGHLKHEYGSGIATTIVVTDIIAVLLLTSLSGVALGGGLGTGAIWLSLLKTLAFLVLAPAFGFLIVPRILNAVAGGTRSREAILITVLALCFGMAVL